ncbi:MAG: PIN domain-containing protein [Deferrisomatales bacterium]|nr:PIN domain-containing protein [Deferrisomatales bacterium]
MSRVFVDTSAIVALLVSSDEAHERAVAAFAGLRRRLASLVTTSYVLVETYALLGRRLGPAAVASFRTDFAPLLEVVWIGEELHDRGLDLLLEKSARTLSLVDAVSFIVLRDLNLREVFAYDAHFASEGYPAA